MTDHGESQEYFERLVDIDSLHEYLTTELGETDNYDVHRHQAGHSNETLFVTWGDRELVIRRPPPGKTADTAHDVLREWKVVSALQETDVLLPRVVLDCSDESIIGSSFYVMEKLEGYVLRHEEPTLFRNSATRRQIAMELVDSLATIHNQDYDSLGLDDFGYPAGYTERQVDRWTKQLEWAFERTAEERSIPVLRRIGHWLDENLPETTAKTLVHGDYKLDNVMYSRTKPPKLVGVFDWEMSTLGDPLTDVGWMLAFWRDEGDATPAVPELATSFMPVSGYPSRVELVKRYESKTGLRFEHERFYRTLTVYKLAALCEMFYRRYLEGNSDDPMYPAMEHRVPALAKRAERIISGDEPL